MVNERIQLKKIKTPIKYEEKDSNDIVRERPRRAIKIKFSPRLVRKKTYFNISNDGIRGEVQK